MRYTRGPADDLNFALQLNLITLALQNEDTCVVLTTGLGLYKIYTIPLSRSGTTCNSSRICRPLLFKNRVR